MMNDFARRLLGAAAAAVARKLLPDNPGSALALRSSDREIEVLPPVDRGSSLAPRSNFFPTVRPSQILYAPSPAPVQPVAAPAPPPRRRRKVVTETITYEEREW